jgi:hypothetical protein
VLCDDYVFDTICSLYYNIVLSPSDGPWASYLSFSFQGSDSPGVGQTFPIFDPIPASYSADSEHMVRGLWLAFEVN